MSQDPAERGRGPYAVAAAGLLAPWGVIKDLPGCLRDRTQVTRSRGAVGIRERNELRLENVVANRRMSVQLMNRC